MKQKLLKTVMPGLLVMVGVNAWADNTVTVTTGGSSTEYATLSAAITAGVLTSASADISDDALSRGVSFWDDEE